MVRTHLGRAMVAAGILPAVEPGILPGGMRAILSKAARESQAGHGRQDAALYGRPEARRYVGDASGPVDLGALDDRQQNIWGIVRISLRANTDRFLIDFPWTN
jgi:hypothetical protein